VSRNAVLPRREAAGCSRRDSLMIAFVTFKDRRYSKVKAWPGLIASTSALRLAHSRGCRASSKIASANPMAAVSLAGRGRKHSGFASEDHRGLAFALPFPQGEHISLDCRSLSLGSDSFRGLVLRGRLQMHGLLRMLSSTKDPSRVAIEKDLLSGSMQGPAESGRMHA